MPELPEVEVLVRHLAPLLQNRKIRGVRVNRAKVLGPTSERQLTRALCGATFSGVTRRGKYLLFTLRKTGQSEPLLLVGHLGMTGRIYLLPKDSPLPKHAAVVVDVGAQHLVYEDTRYFGRLTLDLTSLGRLGPEPLGPEFTVGYFASALKRSLQSIKIKLLDQTLVAGVGNIYASEALFRARIDPRRPARSLGAAEVRALARGVTASMRYTLRQFGKTGADGGGADIEYGSTLPLDFAGSSGRDGLFYYGGEGNSSDFYQERLLVYDRLGRPCSKCGAAIKRLVQAARSTFYCPRCQGS